MKTTILRTLAIILVMQIAICAKAEYISLTVKENSGTWTSFGLTGLKVTFGNDNITVSNQEMTQTYPVADVYSLMLTDLPTAIQQAEQVRTVVSLQGCKVHLNVEVGTLAGVYDSKGNLCATARIGQQGMPVFIGNLQPGIYILKAGKERCKILVK